MVLQTLCDFGLNRPEILTPGLPEADRTAAKLLERALLEMEHILHNFDMAIDLYEACSMGKRKSKRAKSPSAKTGAGALFAGVADVEEARRLSVWRSMAVRDGIMQIWKLGRAIDSTESELHRLPALGCRVNRRGIAKAGKMIERSFPGYAAIRDAVTQSVMERPSSIRESRAKATPGRHNRWGFKFDPRSRGNAITGISGRVLFVRDGRKIRKYELSEQSLRHLSAAVGQFYDAFSC